MKKVMPCEVYSRVVGYFRPVNNWNQGKRQEYSERKAFSEEISMQNPKAKAQVMPLIGGGDLSIDSYKLFTFPNCSKCEEVKAYLSQHELDGSIIDLKSPEGNKEFRSYYSEKQIKDMIKRDQSGALKLPILLLMNSGSVLNAAQGIEETRNILG